MNVISFTTAPNSIVPTKSLRPPVEKGTRPSVAEYIDDSRYRLLFATKVREYAGGFELEDQPQLMPVVVLEVWCVNSVHEVKLETSGLFQEIKMAR